MFVLFDDGFDGGLEVARVVHGVKDTEDVDAVDSGPFDEFFDDVIGVVAVAEDVLSSEQHLLRCFRHRFLQFPEAYPGVFAEEADAGVERGAPPHFDGPVADLIEFIADGEHVIEAQTGGKE